MRSAEDTSIPDLVAEDERGRPVVIVEVKFWAALTPNQPNAYLARQAQRFVDDQHAPRVLTFIVPQRRIELVTAEVSRRLGIEASCIADVPVLATEGRSQVLILTWAQILTALEVALRRTEDAVGRHDLAQLRGLCERSDAEAMMPLAPEDVGADRGRRFFEFCDVLDRTVDTLVAEGVVLTQGTRRGGGKGWYGAGAKSQAGTPMRLEVNAYRWAWMYPTPFWVRIWGGDHETLTAVNPLVRAGTIARAMAHEGDVYVAIDPPLKMEQAGVVALLAQSIRRMCEVLPPTVAVIPRGELNALSEDPVETAAATPEEER